ncbi:helix-turn-helix domain-containing protein [Cellulomonas timonensis]|uniref:helix-turn-helix domain-containing protein n=1 Tax=Cellulomonas timonensis TaxID=1689271 RepID=UPI00082E4D8F|nr:helix-turn-helix transcriptional regulator [Cellulomonas timonensis]
MVYGAPVQAPRTTLIPTQRSTPAPESRAVRGELVEQVQATARQGRSVLLVSAPGMGATFLARKAVEGLVSSGRPGDAFVLQGSPAVGESALAPLATLFGVDLAGAADDAAAAREIAQALTARADVGRAAPVVRVEDLHLLDTATSRMLAWMARQRTITLVATARPSTARLSPWRELWKDGCVQRVDVQPFDRTETADYLVQTLGGPVSADLVMRVWQLTRGSVFLVHELVTHEVDAGRMVSSGGAWQWIGSVQPGPRLLDVVHGGLEQVGPRERRALEVTALAGAVGLDVLGELGASDPVAGLLLDGVLELVPEAEGMGRLVPVVRWRAPIAAAAVRELVPWPQRQEHLRALGRTSYDPDLAGEGIIQWATWSLECGERVAVSRLRAAAELAAHGGVHESVVRLTTVGLDAVTDMETLDRVRLLRTRSSALAFQGVADLARVDLEAALRELTRAEVKDGDWSEHRVDLARRLANLELVYADSVDAAVAAIDVATADLARLEGVPAAVEGRRELAAERLVMLGYGGRFTEQLSPATEMLLAGKSGDVARFPLVTPVMLGLGQAGQFAVARAVDMRYAAVVGAAGRVYPWARAELLGWRTLLAVWAGELSSAREHLAQIRSGAGLLRMDRCLDHLAEGMVAAADGRWSVARNELRTANARSPLRDDGSLTALTLAYEALASAAVGDAPATRDLIERIRRTPLRRARAMQAEIRLVLLDAAAWSHAPDLEAQAVALASWAASQGMHRVEAESLHRAIRARSQRGALPGSSTTDTARALGRLRELTAGIGSERALAMLDHAEAMVSGDAPLVLARAAALGNVGLWLPSASQKVELTRREREIAGLAAAGLSSKVIAERLFLSVRTVDSHLARVFAKLGLHSRAELAQHLG